MAYSTLKRKTSLKAKTSLKTKTQLRQTKSLSSGSGLKTSSTLKTKTSLRDSYNKKLKSGEKKAYKPKVKLQNRSHYFSIFTTDLSECYITHSKKPDADIHIHHIFGASNKANSEEYGYLVPLRADWHDMADYGVHFNKELDLKFKRACEGDWLNKGMTREEFIKTFGKWY